MLINKSYQEDIVDVLFRINLDRSVQELNNDFCKYYFANHIETGEEYYAIIFERDYNIPVNLLFTLKNNRIPNVINLVTFSLVKISINKSWQIVAICEKYDFHSTLDNFIKQKGSLSSELIEQKLIPNLQKIIDYCAVNKIACGNINPKNIIVTNNNNFILREFFVSPENFYQEAPFLPLELLECDEYTKTTKLTSTDIYAAGVTTYYAATGNNPCQEKEGIAAYNNSRLKNGSFYTLLKKQDRFSNNVKLFLKQSLHDNPLARIQNKSIERASNNKNVLYDSSIPINFNGQIYSNLRYLAYGMYNNWDDASLFIEEENLIKWIQRAVSKSTIIDEINDILLKNKKHKYQVYSESQEKLMKLIAVIDQVGPIRVKNFAIHVNSIPDALLYYFRKQKKYDVIIRIIINQYWEKSAKYYSSDISYQECLQRITKFYDKHSYVNGIERIIYDLNQDLCCQSPFLSDEYITSIPDLLVALNRIASFSPDKIIFDKHIIAYIASKLNINKDLNIRHVARYAKIQDNIIVHALYILSIAIYQTQEVKISHLGHTIAVQIINILNENLYNRNLISMLQEEILSAGEAGDLKKIMDIISNVKLYKEDNDGYHQATAEVKKINNEIKYLNNAKTLDYLGTALGQRITVFLSYILCLIITLLLI